MSLEAFIHQSVTVNLAVTGTSQTLATSAQGTIQGLCAYRIANIGTQTVFIDFSSSSTATITTTTGFPVLPNSVEIFRDMPHAYVVAIAAATGSTIYVTLGEGM